MATLPANPGAERVADPSFRADGDRFVRAVVDAGRDSPSLLIWDSIQLTPENVVEHRNLLRWTFISLAWGGALGEHLSEAQELNARAVAAQKQGNKEELRKTLSKLAKLATKLLVQHGFVTEEGVLLWRFPRRP